MVLLRPSHGKVGGHLPLNPLQTTRRIRIRIRLRSEQNPCHSSGNIPSVAEHGLERAKAAAKVLCLS
jgi:hypothetical protein